MSHAMWLEVIWASIAAFGWTLALMSTLDARSDYRYWSRGTPQQRFMTRAIYMGTRWQLWLHSIVLFGTVWGLFHPPPPPKLSAIPQTHMWMFLGIALTISKTFYTRYTRQIRRRVSQGKFE